MNKFVKLVSPLVLIPLIAGCALFGNPVPQNKIELTIKPVGPNGAVIAKAQFKGSFHKDVNIGNMAVQYNPSNGMLTFAATNWASTNNPAVITAGYQGQAVASDSFWNGLNQTISNTANLAAKAGAAVASGGATAVIPAVTAVK